MSEPMTTATTAAAPELTPEKTFTQAEVDAIVGKRLAKAMKGMPDETELTAFRTWKGDRQAEQDRLNTLTTERDTVRTQLTSTQAELEQLKRERILLGKGVAADDVEYYAFKIGKLVDDKTDFSAAAETFFKDNPPKTVRVDMGGGLGGGNTEKTANDTMNALIRGARK